MDHYQTLGVSPDATPEAIRAAFRELSRRHHPDTAGDTKTAKKFQAVKAAYDVLRDPKARAKYDEQLATTDGAPTPHFTWSNIAQPTGRADGARVKGARARSGEDRPDLDVMIDAYFGRWNDPE
jgi:molecular chaperone DnaJ